MQKAESSEFILEVIGKEEKVQLQKALGFGELPIENQSLIQKVITFLSIRYY